MKKNPLRKYLLSLPESSRRQTIQKLMSELNISKSYVYAMYCGIRPVQPKHAVKIERVTKKDILRQDLCPDLYN